MNYTIRRASLCPELNADAHSHAWSVANMAEIQSFRPESSQHRPQTHLRLLHDKDGLHGMFSVRDRYVRSVRTNYFDEVWKDSCVECFLQPRDGAGYFNFEFNAGGAHLVSHITNHERVPGGFKAFTKLPTDIGKQVRVRSSMTQKVDPEITEPIEWTLQFFIPYTVMKPYVGDITPKSGDIWRGNFFKCAEEISHPHWASWSPVDQFNFHLPRCFGSIQFE